MATDKSTNVSADATSQAQSGSAEPDYKAKNAPEKNKDEIQFFDTTIAKLVKKTVDKDEDGKGGHEEWVEVMSDNLYPGEKLKRVHDEEEADKKAEKDRADAEKADRDRK